MRLFIKLLTSLIVVICTCFYASPQKPSHGVLRAAKEYVKKKQKTECLSMEMLKSATEISYGFSNGSVAPECAYYGRIMVTPKNVTLDIFHLSSLCYTRTRKLTAKDYTSFLSRLYSLGVKKNTEEYFPVCGGATFDLKIMKGKKVIFKGTEGEDIVTAKGRINEAFLPLLTSEMRNVYNDPSSTFGTIIDIFPIEN